VNRERDSKLAEEGNDGLTQLFRPWIVQAARLLADINRVLEMGLCFIEPPLFAERL